MLSDVYTRRERPLIEAGAARGKTGTAARWCRLLRLGSAAARRKAGRGADWRAAEEGDKRGGLMGLFGELFGEGDQRGAVAFR